jgi:glycosyltransferase involved in cell wall biosynthesis
METNRKITIVTPVLNAEKDIEACILSVVGQSYPDKEHLIIDGVSTDGTLEIVQRYAEKYSNIKVISEKDNGIYDAMNKAIDLANGDWIYFLGCDDVLNDDKLLNNIFSEDKYSNYDIIYGNAIFKHSNKIYDGKFTKYKLINKNICHQAIFYKKHIFTKFGKYEIKYKGVADWVHNMKCFNGNIKIKYIEDIVAVYNEDGYCFNNMDIEFDADRDMLLQKYFNPVLLFIYDNRDKAVIRNIANLLS